MAAEPIRRATASDLRDLKTIGATSNASAWILAYVTADTSARSWPDGKVEAVFTGRYAVYSDDPAGNWPWDEARCPVARTEPLGSSGLTLLRMAQPCFDNAQRGGYYYPGRGVHGRGDDQAVGIPDHFENRASPLRPGEFWAADDSVTFRAAVKPTTAVVPLLESLLEIDGASGVVVQGLTFEAATWHKPSSSVGYVDLQAGATVSRNLSDYPHAGWDLMPASVEVRGSADVMIQQSTFRHLGGGGVKVGNGSRDCRIEGCLLEDISGCGIMLGGVANKSLENATADALRLSAVNNHLRDVPVEYHGSVGIFACAGTVCFGCHLQLSDRLCRHKGLPRLGRDCAQPHGAAQLLVSLPPAPCCDCAFSRLTESRWRSGVNLGCEPPRYC